MNRRSVFGCMFAGIMAMLPHRRQKSKIVVVDALGLLKDFIPSAMHVQLVDGQWVIVRVAGHSASDSQHEPPL